MPGPWSWKQKTWKCHNCKHHWLSGPPKNDTWASIRAKTKLFINGMRPRAKYYPSLSRADWKKLEEDTLASVTVNGTETFYHEFDGEREEKRTFCREVADLPHPLGASMGEDTNWVYVEWLSNPQGEFHGRPITVAELRKLGAEV